MFNMASKMSAKGHVTIIFILVQIKVLETCLALRYWFVGVLGSKSVKQYFIEIFYIHAIYTLPMDTGFDSKLKAYMKVISYFRYNLYNMCV